MPVTISDNGIEIGGQACGAFNSNWSSGIDLPNIVLAYQSRLNPTSLLNQTIHGFLVEELAPSAKPSTAGHMRILDLTRALRRNDDSRIAWPSVMYEHRCVAGEHIVRV